MKKQFWIVVMTVLSVAMYGKAASNRMVSTGNVHMCLVVDCGKTDTFIWDTIRARAIEMVCLLKTGDRITIINAYPSEPRLFESAELLSDSKTPVDSMVKRLGTLDKDWFVRSTLSAAVGLSYEKLIFEPSARNCCIVLTSGDITDDQIKNLSRLAVMFKAKNWPIVLICEHTAANRQLLVSGIEVRYLDNPGISEWIANIRPVVKKDPEPNLPSAPRLVPEPKQPPASNTPIVHGQNFNIKPDNAPMTAPDQKKPETIGPELTPKPQTLPAETNDPNLRPDSTVQPLPKDDANKVSLPSPPKKTDPKDCNKPDKLKDSRKPNNANSKESHAAASLFARWYFWALAAICVLFPAVAYAYFKISGGNNTVSKVTDDAEVPKSLIAYIGDDRRELGSLHDVREIIIGSGLGSTVFISGEGIAAQHLKIFSSGNTLKLQNYSDTTITVNGLSVKPRGKMKLDLPSEIELIQNVSIVLIEEECK
jgi:hypothetical protein